MALFDYACDEVIGKIVYYGADQAGKTTNLRHIHGKLTGASTGELAIVTSESGGLLLLDLVSHEPVRVAGLRLRFQLCALEGPGSSVPARGAGLLKGADGIVFVADSRAEAVEAGAQSFESLRAELTRQRGDSLPPIVVQYNKRDLATVLPLETLRERLNQREVPSVEAIAVHGIGVAETLRLITRLCCQALVASYGETSQPQRVERRRSAKPSATTPHAPGEPRQAPPGRSRLPTHQSLAGKSLPPAPPAAEPGRAARIRITKPELLETLRTEAEMAGKGEQPPEATPPPTKKE